MKKFKIIKSQISITTKSTINKKVLDYLKIKNKKGFYICVSAVHSCIEAYKSNYFKKVHNSANIAVPDGRPLFWMLKINQFKNAEHIPGYMLTDSLCNFANTKKFRMGIYGSKRKVINKFIINIKIKYKNINFVFHQTHPHKILSDIKHQKLLKKINKSKIDILFVCLGCPLQEQWMFQNKNNISSVMVGIGAAVDFISGNKLLAPKIIEKLGFSWFFRLVTEPKRLFMRYFITNSLFLILIFKQIFQKLIFNR